MKEQFQTVEEDPLGGLEGSLEIMLCTLRMAQKIVLAQSLK